MNQGQSLQVFGLRDTMASRRHISAVVEENPRDGTNHAHVLSPRGCVTGLVCTRCGRHDDMSAPRLTCPVCGLEGILDVLYDSDAARVPLARDALARVPQSHRRYRALLPLPATAPVPVAPVGWTPVFEATPEAAQEALR